MLAKIKEIIAAEGLPEFRARIKDTKNIDRYVASYHRHSNILTKREISQQKFTEPLVTSHAGLMTISLTGDHKGDPINIDGITKIVLDLRNHIGGNLHNSIRLLANIYGDTTLFHSCKEWWSLVGGSPVEGKISDELAFQGFLLVLVGKRTMSSGEIVALTFMNRSNTLVIGDKTGGFLTMNNFYDIDDKHILNLTISKFTDITGKEYDEECITPAYQI